MIYQQFFFIAILDLADVMTEAKKDDSA